MSHDLGSNRQNTFRCFLFLCLFYFLETLDEVIRIQPLPVETIAGYHGNPLNGETSRWQWLESSNPSGIPSRADSS